MSRLQYLRRCSTNQEEETISCTPLKLACFVICLPQNLRPTLEVDHLVMSLRFHRASLFFVSRFFFFLMLFVLLISLSLSPRFEKVLSPRVERKFSFLVVSLNRRLVIVDEVTAAYSPPV